MASQARTTLVSTPLASFFLVAHVPSDIPEANYKLSMPVFFGGCLRDYVCRADVGVKRTSAYCTNLTTEEYDSDHWVMLATPEKLNNDLLKWITSVTSS